MSEKIVQEGYDAVGKKYVETRGKYDNAQEFEEFIKLLPRKAKILDAGCGAGIPVAKLLAEKGYDVTGIDISEKMLEMAHKNVPKANFLQMSITAITYKPEIFDGIIAAYSVIHIPKENHARVFEQFNNILKENGILLISLGMKEFEGTSDWHGANMFWSHYDAKKSMSLVKAAGFEIIFGKKVETGQEKNFWILARKK
jgi:2-polyprenyl-3-methyl-5-hydroxy-6-metoxy-1,4-benzoquinol methylase